VHSYCDHRALHSFPTRRSSDLAAGAWIAASSEAEVRATEGERRRFLGESASAIDTAETPLASAMVVGASYFAGALVPVLPVFGRSEEHTSELQSLAYLVCRLLL